jgi:hypothetical protein
MIVEGGVELASVDQVHVVRHALDAIDAATIARPSGIIVNDETRAPPVIDSLRHHSIGEGRGLVPVVHPKRCERQWSAASADPGS